jgi:hypothetical protein
MSGLNTEGLREFLAAYVAEGHSASVIREAVVSEFPDLDVPSQRSVRRWLQDPEVRRLTADYEADRERSILRQSRAQLARRLEDGDTGDLSPRELLAIGKDSRPVQEDFGIDLGAWPDLQSAAIAQCWQMFGDDPSLLDENQALANYMGVSQHVEQSDDERFAEVLDGA